MNMKHPVSLSLWSKHAAAASLALLLFLHPALALSQPFFAAAETLSPEIPATLPDAPLPADEAFTITILDGEGALNNIRQRTAREPIVQVEDKNHKPVAGALVLFAINDSSGGAGATVNGLSTFSVTTDAAGKAQLHGLTPNNVNGDFTITVTATVGSVVVTAIIHQKNEGGLSSDSQQSSSQASSQPGNQPSQVVRSGHHNLIFRGSLIGGAVVAGVIVAVVLTQKSSGAQISTGATTVGAP